MDYVRYKGTSVPVIGWFAIKALYEDLFAYVLIALATWASVLSVVLSFPAIAALHEMARRTLDGRAIGVGTWWTEMKQGFRRAWGLGLLCTFITLILMANVIFYGRQTGSLWQYVAALWLVLSLWWGLSACYVWALHALQEDSRPVIVVRNAIFLTALRPLHALSIPVLFVPLTALSVALPLFLLVLPAYWALYTTLLARQLVRDIQRHHAD